MSMEKSCSFHVGSLFVSYVMGRQQNLRSRICQRCRASVPFIQRPNLILCEAVLSTSMSDPSFRGPEMLGTFSAFACAGENVLYRAMSDS